MSDLRIKALVQISIDLPDNAKRIMHLGKLRYRPIEFIRDWVLDGDPMAEVDPIFIVTGCPRCDIAWDEEEEREALGGRMLGVQCPRCEPPTPEPDPDDELRREEWNEVHD